MKRIGVLTSGGDAPGMNAAIRAAVRTALANSVEIVGVKRGYAGLINGDTVSMNWDSVANIVHQGAPYWRRLVPPSSCPGKAG